MPSTLSAVGARLRLALVSSALLTITLASPAARSQSAAALPLDDASATFTVMQFTLKPGASRDELKARMGRMRDHMRKQPGLIDNVLVENRSPGNAPQFVGVSRWRSLKDWEATWQAPDMVKILAAISEAGTITPGVFSPVGK